jgi:hypothetical protein
MSLWCWSVEGDLKVEQLLYLSLLTMREPPLQKTWEYSNITQPLS